MDLILPAMLCTPKIWNFDIFQRHSGLFIFLKYTLKPDIWKYNLKYISEATKILVN